MSRLDELIEELCPNGVEFRQIKDVYRRIKGTPITAGKMKEIADEEGDIRIFAGGKTVIDAYEKDIPNANITRVPAVLVQSRGVIDFIFYDKPFTFKNEMWAYTNEEVVSVKYLYYVLKNNVDKFREAASGMGALPQISLPVTETFVIPVPPQEVQFEIVDILDRFTLRTKELTTDLTEELIARKKQYEYYRDWLFDSIVDFETKTLGEMCSLVTKQTGFDYTNKIKNKLVQEPSSNTIPYIQTKFFEGKHFNYDTDYYVPNDLVKVFPKITLDQRCLLFSIVGASIGNVGLFPATRKCFLGGAICVAKPKEEINVDYLFYYMTSKHGQKQILSKVKGAGQATVTIEDIRGFLVPLPSSKEQQCIVNFLEQFDAFYNKITKTLSAEIDTRQKQYEYYRDKLFTFRERTI